VLGYLINWFSGWKEYTGEAERFIDAGDWVVEEAFEALGLSEQDAHTAS
jgi:hypothetical protein